MVSWSTPTVQSLIGCTYSDLLKSFSVAGGPDWAHVIRMVLTRPLFNTTYPRILWAANKLLLFQKRSETIDVVSSWFCEKLWSDFMQHAVRVCRQQDTGEEIVTSLQNKKLIHCQKMQEMTDDAFLRNNMCSFYWQSSFLWSFRAMKRKEKNCK